MLRTSMATCWIVAFVVHVLILESVSTSPQAATLLLQPSDHPLQLLLPQIVNQHVNWTLTTRQVQSQAEVSEWLQNLCETIETHHLPIGVSVTPENIAMMKSVAVEMRVPLFTWNEVTQGSRELTEELDLQQRRSQSCGLFFTRPSLTIVLSELLWKRKWLNFVYIYTSRQSFYRMEEVVEALSNLLLNVTELDVDSYQVDFHHVTSARRLLKLIDMTLEDSPATTERLIVIDEQSKTMLENAIGILRSLGMLRMNYEYILVSFNLMDLSLGPFKGSGVHLFGFSMFDFADTAVMTPFTQWAENWPTLAAQHDLHELAFFVDTVNTMLNIFSTQNLFENQSSSEISCYNLTRLRRSYAAPIRQPPNRSIGNWSYQGITGKIAFNPKTCQRDHHEILISEFFGDQGGHVIGKWRSDDGLYYLEGQQDSHMDRLAGLKDKEDLDHVKETQLRAGIIRVVTILSKPFMMYSPGVKGEPTSGKDNFIGYCKELADKLFQKLNMEYELHLVHDGRYGAYDPVRKRWNGIVGEIIDGTADVAIAPLTVSSSRERDIDFTEPFMTFGLTVLIKRPEKTKPGTFSFMFPLSNTIWFCIFSAFFAVTIELYIIAKISPFEWHRPKREAFSFGNCLWYALANFLHQGVAVFPVSPGARIVGSAWRFFSLVVISYYTANLAACFSVERLAMPISSVQDLIEKPELGIAVGSLESGSTKEYFAMSNMYPYNRIHDKMQRDKSVYVPKTDEGLRRVRSSKGKYAFVLESKMAAYINNHFPCDTMTVDAPFGHKEYAVAISQTNATIQSIKDDITVAILNFREEQELARMYKRWWIEKGECPDSGSSSLTSTNDSDSLALVNVSGVFYVLIIGMVLSSLQAMLSLGMRVTRGRRHQHPLDEMRHGQVSPEWL